MLPHRASLLESEDNSLSADVGPAIALQGLSRLL